MRRCPLRIHQKKSKKNLRMAGASQRLDTDSYVNRAEFEAFCDDMYPHGAVTKTMRSERRDLIAGWLKGIHSPPRGNWRYRMMDKGYTLISFPELGLEDVLCLKGAQVNGVIEHGTYGEWRRVVSVEEFYNILLNTHVHVLNHGGYRNLIKALETDYTGIPRAAIIRFVNMCSECQKNPRQQSKAHASSGKKKVVKLGAITRDFNRRCQVDVLDMTLCPDGQYSYIGLYTDHWTKFVTLFPMMGCSPEHVAYGLASSVYPYYGPPHFLHSTEGKEFAEKVVMLSIDKWKGGEVTVVPRPKDALMHMKEAVERTRDLLIQLLNTRASNDKVEGALPWASWLGKIMYDINSQQNASTSKSPYKRVFERTLLFMSEETTSMPHGSGASGQSSAGRGSRRKRQSSSSSDDAGIIMTSYKTPHPVGALKPLKRPSTFVAISTKR